MIYNLKNDRTLKYSSVLIDYIKEKNRYTNENLMYTTQYTDGTFSITNPTSEYKNCEFINGYPHFYIPLDICLQEINDFINNKKIYNNNFYFRYGDTHPHKPIPKLAQIRNLLIEESLSSMILTKKSLNSFYTIGDISIKTIEDFIYKNNLNISSQELQIKIVNGLKLDDNIEKNLNNYNLNALNKIKKFLSELKIKEKQFLFESSIYQKQGSIYKKLKNNNNYKSELKDNGELKYSLQELMVIFYILNEKDDVLYSIIGDNQSDHILKVNNILKENYCDLNFSFLTYGICRNGEERNILEWTNHFEKFIQSNNLCINNRLITTTDFLKIIVTTLNNDNQLDFSNLEKYIKNYASFVKIINSINSCSKKSHKDIIDINNNLINNMALVYYYLNRSVEMGNQFYFYNYLIKIINEYEQNKEKYFNMSNLYYNFVNAALTRLDLIEILENSNAKRKELKI